VFGHLRTLSNRADRGVTNEGACVPEVFAGTAKLEDVVAVVNFRWCGGFIEATFRHGLAPEAVRGIAPRKRREEVGERLSQQALVIIGSVSRHLPRAPTLRRLLRGPRSDDWDVYYEPRDSESAVPLKIVD